MHWYYYDLGFTYYILYLYTTDPELMRQRIVSFEKCIAIKPKFGTGHFNLAAAYAENQQCTLARKHFRLYRKYTRKKYIDYEQIDMYLLSC